jgi:phosphohistidine swiveling domain-containing protein
MKKNSVKIIVKETNMNYYSWGLISDGFLFDPDVKKYIGASLNGAVSIIKNDSGSWGVVADHWNYLGKKLNRRLERGAFRLENLILDHQTAGEKIIKFCDNILNRNLKEITNTDFRGWFTSTWKNLLKLNGLGFAPVISDFEHNYLTKKLIDILERHEKDVHLIQSHLSILISADRPDLNWQELLDFFTLIKKKKNIDSLKNSKQLGSHIRKYNWLNFGYIGPAWSKKDFLNRARKIISYGDAVPRQLMMHKKHFKDIKTEQRKLERLLHLNEHEKYLFEVARVFMFCKAYRLNVRHQAQYVFELIFGELCCRNKLDINSLRYATRQEINDFLSGKAVNMKKIAHRRKGMVEITENKKQRIDSLLHSKKVFANIIIAEMQDNSQEIQGQAAFLGKVRGRAKIVFGPRDMHKVRRGDILFAMTTTPDLLPAMEKAAAFVTDQGGITSHAAIVAREMKKPCVIGTKIGTKNFKDNDLVEVDANNGIVKILSK